MDLTEVVAQEVDELAVDAGGISSGGLGRQPHQVQRLSHSERLKAVQDIATFSLAPVTNVIIHKD